MRRRRNRKQVRVVIGLSICLLLIMTVGYAAFSTNLTLTAKGNIHNLTTIDNLKSKVVTEGDGLYIDTYEVRHQTILLFHLVYLYQFF